MQFKNTFVTLFILICVVFASVNASACRTAFGDAWCEGVRCWKTNNTIFKNNVCRAPVVNGVFNFNGATCRRCPSSRCGLTANNLHSKLQVYSSANGYLLTQRGWCFL
ncbi:hypothetical protein BCR36DRAFT_587570, partial [Piromyces finnis]